MTKTKWHRAKPIVEAPIDLNNQQMDAYCKMIDFIEGKDPGTMFLLQGYAGTGKTYLVSKILDYIFKTRKHPTIAVTAPTNKAVKILRRSSINKNNGLTFATIHSLLGLREQITDTGDQIFVSAATESPSLRNFLLLIIDEVSMLPDELFLKIEKYKHSVKIIMMGDPAQIPPVMRHECIPFMPERQDEFKIRISELTEIMRQKKGNSIIETSFQIRENVGLNVIPINRVKNLTPDETGVHHLDPSMEDDRRYLMQLLEEHFHSDAFKADSDYVKVISWTNKSVKQMNGLIRKMIYGEKLQKIMVGEKLLANKPIIEVQPKIGKVILFTSNDEFEVLSYEVLTDERFFFYYHTTVEHVLVSGEKVKTKIKILHEDSEPEFTKKLNEIKREAMNESDIVRKRSAWRYYYDFLSTFADVAYNYAITGHKSQGSTYKNTFVLEDDIDQNHKTVERNRIKYTACTRSTDKLFLIHKQ